ncbi:Mitochondrial inner membrane protein SHH3 [Candida viswanathii]|uniref:Mitochondrial inner membrane protein SHH3 n=1 Tax=Candida viswanathii TaxID=5486 RepID=A0A367XN06_9ASCO|nr:Mitochondrial inner membrane protein SHH3 [Candida viswanathii]
MISRVGLLKRPVLSSAIIRAAIAPATTRSLMTARFLSTRTPTLETTSDAEQDILVAQRRNRPTSPHLQIYQPQLTWILSSFHRITGVAMAGAFYALTCTFAATSILGIHFDTATLVSAFTSLPVVLQYGIKALCAYPFVFHVGNGIRHLVWDFGKELTIKGVYRTGYAVLAATAVVGSYLAFVWQ